MKKEVKYNGFSAVPSDYECPDGDLAAALNLIPEDGHLKPILPPKELFQIVEPYNIFYIHGDRYIIADSSQLSGASTLFWIAKSDTQSQSLVTVTADMLHLIGSFSGIMQISSLGNTLIVLDNNGINFCYWSNGSYSNLGNHLPEISAHFEIEEVTKEDSISSMPGFNVEALTKKIESSKVEAITEKCLASLNSVIAEEYTNKGYFAHPFFVRYAYRLYDETSLVMHSAPLLIDITSARNSITSKVYVDGSAGGHYSTDSGGNVTHVDNGNFWEYQVVGGKLKYQFANTSALQGWKDIVQSVDIYISQPLYTYNQAGQVEEISYDKVPLGIENLNFVLPGSSAKDMKEKIINNSLFYLVHSIPVSELDNNEHIPDLNNKLLALVNREVLADDYDSHDLLKPQFAFPYNARLNLANINKRLFAGFSLRQLNYSTDTSSFGVTAKTAVVYEYQGKRIVTNINESNIGNAGSSRVFYYNPSPYAKELYIQLGSMKYHLLLSRHDTLVGTYALIENWSDYTYQGDIPEASTDNQIELPNKLYTSEVNNPFVYPVKGINTVGTGEIRGISSATKALSEGQYGQFPLYVFVSDGVWSMEVSSEGKYSTKQVVTRDVCVYPDSITQIDTAVVFASDRGVMLLSGSNSVCLSDTINNQARIALIYEVNQDARGSLLPGLPNAWSEGNVDIIPFLTYLQLAKMVYDYTHQRIIIFHQNKTLPAYVYSLKSKAWGMTYTKIAHGVNSYPEALAMVVSGNHEDNIFVNVSDNKEGVTQQPCLLVTRPLKLDTPDDLKTVDNIIQRGYFRKNNIAAILYASRDNFNWHYIYSSQDHYLRGFSGTPYKYFRIALVCNLQPDESIYGCTIQYAPRQTNQPR